MAWTKYKELKYALDGIPDANLTGFPKRFKIEDDADIASELTSGGGIKITSPDGLTDLPIELLGSGTDLASGDLHVYTILDLLTAASAGDVLARLYYSADESTTEDHAGVWATDYLLVMHLEEDPSGSSPQMYDSVSETNVGTSAGSMTSGDLVAGQVGQGLDLDGSDDSVSCGDLAAADVGTGDFAVEFAVKSSGFGTNKTILAKDDWDSGSSGILIYTTTNTAELRYWSGAGRVFGATVANGAWRAVAVSRASGTAKGYLDGTEVFSGADTRNLTNAFPVVLANDKDFNRAAACLMDEVRISSVARTADWLAYAYADDFANADTFTLGDEQGGGGGGAFTLTAEPGSISLAGQAASLEYGRLLSAGAGSLALAGQTTSLEAGRLLTAASGSYTLSGQDASFPRTYAVSAGAGSLALAGQVASLELGRLLTALSGTLTLAGQTTSLLVDRQLIADSGALALSGQVSALEAGRLLSADAGILDLAGQDAALTYSSAGNQVLAAEAGSLTLIGGVASLEHHRQLVADSASISLTGQDVGLLADRNLIGSSGTIALAGQTADLTATRVMLATGGTFTFTGQPADLLRDYPLTASPGSIFLSGQTVFFPRDYLHVASAGSFLLTGHNALFVYSGDLDPTAPIISDLLNHIFTQTDSFDHPFTQLDTIDWPF